MKYVIGFVLIALMVRIDVVLKVFDNALAFLGRESTPVISATEVRTTTDLVSVKDDKAVKPNPKNTFINMLENFASSPDATIRLKAMEAFRSQPTMFKLTKDTELEGAISSWRDLIVQNSPELPLFLLDLLTILQGENKEIIVRFYSLLMDNNLNLFLSTYTKSKDTNCSIATVVGDPLPEEEKINELYDRERALNTFVSQEKIDENQKAFANVCLLVLRLHLAKLAPPEGAPASDTPEGALSPEAIPNTQPAPSETQP